MAMQEIKLNGHSGRLDRVLTDLLEDTSRSTVQKLISQGKVRVNQRKVKANYLLQGNEVLEVESIEPEIEDFTLIAEDIPLDIVYEDEDLLVINKAAQQVVHPSKGHSSGTLVNALLFHLGNNLSHAEDKIRPGIVHRLDKDTTGLIVVAKNNDAHRRLAEQIQSGQMTRQYLALVAGTFNVKAGKIELPLARDPKNRLKWHVDKIGKEALTSFEVLENYHQMALLRLQLHTGRTHQLRVHLEHINHPIIGDPVYRQGLRQFPEFINRYANGQYLHAQKLSFYHPTSKELMVFETDLPDRFQILIEENKLRGA